MSASGRKLLTTVKLRQVSYRKGDKNYTVFQVTIPKHIVEELGWSGEMELVVLTYDYRGVKSVLLVPANEFLSKIVESSQT